MARIEDISEDQKNKLLKALAVSDPAFFRLTEFARQEKLLEMIARIPRFDFMKSPKQKAAIRAAVFEREAGGESISEDDMLVELFIELIEKDPEFFKPSKKSFSIAERTIH